jgi:alpha-tubulin suppressor-like RCC1 family protein
VPVDGTGTCRGANGYVQLGDGTPSMYGEPPVPVSGLSNARSISAGRDYACAALLDGTAKCWGCNAYGQLGDGTTTGRSAPVVVLGLTDVHSVTVGYDHTCAILQDGIVKCWRRNDNGQLGDGTTTDKYAPVAVTDLSSVVSISAGSLHSCAVSQDGTVQCWGQSFYGQLGGAPVNYYSSTLVLVPGLSNAHSFSAGNHHTCAVLQDGTETCWGPNGSGQLGDGTTNSHSSRGCTQARVGFD